MLRQYHLDAHLGCTLHYLIKIVNLEPQQNAVSIWFVMWVGYLTMMMFYFEAVQLKHKFAA